MKVDRRTDGTLVIRANPLALQATLGGLGAAVLAGVVLQEPRDEVRLWLGGLGALLPLLGAALLERVRFEFDVARQRVRWQRRNWFRGRSGELPFTEISDVLVRVRRERDPDRPRAPEASAHYVVLVTPGGDLRLSNRMYADASETSAVADAIRAALGRGPGAAPAEETIEQLAAAGETIAAVELARRSLGLDLTAAKQHVDRLRR